MAIDRAKVQILAQKYFIKGQTDKAIKEYLLLYEDNQSDMKVCQKLGDLYIKKIFIDKAISDVRISCAANLKRCGRTRKNIWKTLQAARMPKMNFLRAARGLKGRPYLWARHGMWA